MARDVESTQPQPTLAPTARAGAPLEPAARAGTRLAPREQVLLVGFLLCLVIAAITVVLPELSGGGDTAHKQPATAPK
jgi:hypothetical protein